jgi:hypothetical protein
LEFANLTPNIGQGEIKMTTATAMSIAGQAVENFPVSELTGFSLVQLGYIEQADGATIQFTLEFDGVCQVVMAANAKDVVGKIRGRLHKLRLREIAAYIIREVAFRYVLDRFGETSVLVDTDLFEKVVRRLCPRTIKLNQLEEYLRAIQMAA